jgi:hypothetical protein
MGFIRDVWLAMIFGAGGSFDAFVVAFRLPNFLRRLFAEGAFSQAFVPVLAEYKETHSPDDLKLFVGRMQGCLLTILLIVVAVGEILAPLLVTLFAPGFLHDPVRFKEALHMLHITFPYIFFISWVALLGAIYNTWKRFAIPAATPILLNTALILAAVVVAPHLPNPIYALAWGVFFAGIVQLFWQLPMLIKLKLLYRPRFWRQDPGVKRVLKLYAKRWQIETLFGGLKSKGFYFEDTSILRCDRIKKLIALLSIAFCWAHVTGEWSHRHEKIIPIKKHGRLQESYFQRGLDKIKECLFQRGQKLRHLATLFRRCFEQHPQPGLAGAKS